MLLTGGDKEKRKEKTHKRKKGGVYERGTISEGEEEGGRRRDEGTRKGKGRIGSNTNVSISNTSAGSYIETKCVIGSLW